MKPKLETGQVLQSLHLPTLGTLLRWIRTGGWSVGRLVAATGS
ncbi:uncharacterized protein PgNI_08860, partial [Pyricularia grisea]|uniref:Uncharacterized protein n=1 Tax=Pyricularia grisea TaxID=148305 RepID=A0A6P8AVX7_PYRGI